MQRQAREHSQSIASHRYKKAADACWNEFSVDGALANICTRVERPMRRSTFFLGGKVNTTELRETRILLFDSLDSLA